MSDPGATKAVSQVPGAGPRVQLRRGRARPIWFGHPWIYGNAVQRTAGDPGPGDIVKVFDSEARFIGVGMWNPNSQIQVRMLSLQDSAVDAGFFRDRLQQAKALRQAIGLPSTTATAETTAYRLVNSEGDGLPGLVVDVYGDAAVVQITTLALWQRREEIFSALETVLKPKSISLRESGTFGDVEGFSGKAEVVRGEARETVRCSEDGLTLEIEPLAGQKTGMFIDQRPARIRVGALARGRRVLDLYAYAGGFSLQAARGGAASVTAVDSSARAVERVKAHAKLNEVSINAIEADVFRFLDTATPASFDLIIVDPPKFARSRKDQEAAQKAYQRLNELALRACAPGAILVTCSCSQNVSEEDLERAVGSAAKKSERTLRIFERGGAGPDHPLPPGFDEGRYLKVLFAYVE